MVKGSRPNQSLNPVAITAKLFAIDLHRRLVIGGYLVIDARIHSRKTDHRVPQLRKPLDIEGNAIAGNLQVEQ